MKTTPKDDRTIIKPTSVYNAQPNLAQRLVAQAIAAGLIKPGPVVDKAKRPTPRRFSSAADRLAARQIQVAEYRDQRRKRGLRANGRPRIDRKLNRYPHGAWWKSAVQRATSGNKFYRKLDGMKLA